MNMNKIYESIDDVIHQIKYEENNEIIGYLDLYNPFFFKKWIGHGKYLIDVEVNNELQKNLNCNVIVIYKNNNIVYVNLFKKYKHHNHIYLKHVYITYSNNIDYKFHPRHEPDPIINISNIKIIINIPFDENTDECIIDNIVGKRVE